MKHLGSIRHRKEILAGIAVVLVLAVPFTSFYYFSSQQDPLETVIYETSPSGIVLSIGAWLYDTVIVEAPPPELHRMVSYRLNVLDWRNAPDELWFVHECRPVTLGEFEMMNDTEREQAGFTGGSLITRQHSEITGGWWGLSGIWGTQVWAVRFLDTNWNVTEGSLSFTLKVVMADLPDFP